jgi:hypothetical protein
MHSWFNHNVIAVAKDTLSRVPDVSRPTHKQWNTTTVPQGAIYWPAGPSPSASLSTCPSYTQPVIYPAAPILYCLLLSSQPYLRHPSRAHSLAYPTGGLGTRGVPGGTQAPVLPAPHTSTAARTWPPGGAVNKSMVHAGVGQLPKEK